MRALRLLVILGNIGLFGMFIYLAISEGDVHGKFWLPFFAILSFFILNIYFIIFKNNDKEFSLEKIEKIFKGFKSEWIKENWFKVGLLILGLIIAYSFYHALVIRPDIERERKDAEQAKEEIAKELENKRAESKLKQEECESLSDGVRKRWSNAIGVTYDAELWQECVVTYTDTKTGEIKTSPLKFMQDVK